METTTLTVKARFDGQVFVPEQPVNLPPGSVVHIPLPQPPATPPLAALVELLERFPSNPDWPAAAAAQHDHYLFRHAKRP